MSEYGRSFCDIFPKELELKNENQGDYGMLLSFYLKIKELTFIYKLFDNKDSLCF